MWIFKYFDPFRAIFEQYFYFYCFFTYPLEDWSNFVSFLSFSYNLITPHWGFFKKRSFIVRNKIWYRSLIIKGRGPHWGLTIRNCLRNIPSILLINQRYLSKSLTTSSPQKICKFWMDHEKCYQYPINVILSWYMSIIEDFC